MLIFIILVGVFILFGLYLLKRKKKEEKLVVAKSGMEKEVETEIVKQKEKEEEEEKIEKIEIKKLFLFVLNLEEGYWPSFCTSKELPLDLSEDELEKIKKEYQREFQDKAFIICTVEATSEADAILKILSQLKTGTLGQSQTEKTQA